MTELKDLKVGDEVTLTIKAKVIFREKEGNQEYTTLDFAENADYVAIGEEHVNSGAVTIDRAPRPIPTEDGLYIPANNVSNPESSWLFSLMTEFREESEWLVYGSDAAVITGNEALLEVRRAHENLGGLVRLVPEQ